MTESYTKTPDGKIIYSKLLDYLSRQDHSEKKLITKMLSLKKRFPNAKRYLNFTPNNVQQVIDDLKSLGLLNEKRTLKTMADNSLTKDYGPRRLKLKMLRGGYKKELIEQTMKELAESNQQPDFSKIIRLTVTKKRVLENKYRSDLKKLRTVRQRLVQFLAQRGYDFDNIKKILEKVYQA